MDASLGSGHRRRRRRQRRHKSLLPPSIDPDAACYLCLDGGSDESPLQRDCSCRGTDVGYVHFSCLAQYATFKTKGWNDEDAATMLTVPWTHCQLCLNEYQNDLKINLATEFVSLIQREYPDNEPMRVYSLHIKMLVLSNKLVSSSSSSYQQKEIEVIAKLLLTMINRLKIVDESLDYLKVIEINAYNSLGGAVLRKKTEASSNEALAHYEKCLALSQAIEYDEGIATAKYNIAIVKSAYLNLDGNFDEDLLNEAQATYDIFISLYGLEDVDTLGNGLDVVTALVRNNRGDDALNLLTKMLATSKQTHGSDHDITKKIRKKMDVFADFAHLSKLSSAMLVEWISIAYDSERSSVSFVYP